MKPIEKSTHVYVSDKKVLEYHFISANKLNIMPIEGIFEMKSKYPKPTQELMYLINYK